MHVGEPAVDAVVAPGELRVLDAEEQVNLRRAEAAGAISPAGSRTTLRNMLLAAGRFGRRIVYAGLCLASIASIAWLYLGAKAYGGTFLAAATLAGAALIWLIPETKGRPLPE